MSFTVVKELIQILEDRKNADPKTSYVAKMYNKGTPKIAQKIGEEAAEVIIEAIRVDEKPKSKKRREALKEELADLVFHTQILMTHLDIDPEEIWEILRNRMGINGLDEKKSRKEK